MPESETSKKITRVIRIADELAQDLVKGAEELREAMKELKGEKKEGEEEKGE